MTSSTASHENLTGFSSIKTLFIDHQHKILKHRICFTPVYQLTSIEADGSNLWLMWIKATGSVRPLMRHILPTYHSQIKDIRGSLQKKYHLIEAIRRHLRHQFNMYPDLKVKPYNGFIPARITCARSRSSTEPAVRGSGESFEGLPAPYNTADCTMDGVGLRLKRTTPDHR